MNTCSHAASVGKSFLGVENMIVFSLYEILLIAGLLLMLGVVIGWISA